MTFTKHIRATPASQELNRLQAVPVSCTQGIAEWGVKNRSCQALASLWFALLVTEKNIIRFR